jgi:cytochrome c5
VLGSRINATESDKLNIEVATKQVATKQIKSAAVASSPVSMGGQCPDCGGMLVYQEGCLICHSCGYTKCS